MNRIDQISNTIVTGSTYNGLYKAGAASALMAALLFRRNLDAEWMLITEAGIINAVPSVPPTTISDWFTLLQDHKLLGLTLLSVFDLVNYALVGLIFLALCIALRKVSPSWVVAAGVLSLAGIIAYFASNQAFTMLSLSNQYAAATTEVRRMILLAAGQAVLAIHQNASYAGTGIYLSYFLVSAAGMILSAVMLRSQLFRRGSAAMGILANGFGLAYYIVLAFAPALVFIPISISAIFLLIWYTLVGSRLWALGSQRTADALRTDASKERRASRKGNISPCL